MVSARWNIYRVFNYILLASSSVIFLVLARQFVEFKRSGIAEKNIQLVIAFVIYTSLFMSMIISSLVNVVIMSKTFPDKLLSAQQHRWHIFSCVLNALALVGLLVALITLLKEITDPDRVNHAPQFFVLAMLLTLLVVLVFIFVCQLLLKKYLRTKNEVTVKSMIDSIGNENEPA